MRAVNYDREMQKIIESFKGQKPKLLLHSCCAPCSSYCIERLKEHFDLCIYYYNPNLDTADEFSLRSAEQIRLCDTFGVKCIVVPYDKQEYLLAVNGLEHLPEGGERCSKCFYLRLKKTAEEAKQNGFEYFATTLTISPLKNAKKLNDTGEAIAQEVGVKFLPSDFKKNNGYLRSIELSKEHNLYRQNYCGCEFSKGAVPNQK